ncbi:MAG: protein kinase [Candidatus Berkiella sp.]
MPRQTDAEVAAITQAVSKANSLDKLIEVIAAQDMLLAQNGAELDKNKMIVRLMQIKNDKLVLQAAAQGNYPWGGSDLTSNYNLRNKIEECAKKAFAKLNAAADDDSDTEIDSPHVEAELQSLSSDDDLPVVNLAAPFRYVPKSQAAIPKNADFKDFVERLSLVKWHTPGPKLGALLSSAAREKIFDYFLADTDPSVAAHFSGTQLLKIRREMANIAALKPGEAYRLDKKITGLPRTLNVLRGDDGQFMLIVETKSKLANESKQKLPHIGGTTKTGKPAWRIDAGEVEYFNLVAKVRDQHDIIELSQEVELSKKMASPEVQQNVLGAKFTNKGQEKISVYSVKADDSLETIVRNGTTKGLSIEEQDSLILELLKGTKIFHDQNYVHQDLKPGNILVYKDAVSGYHLKLTDFGLVRKNGYNEAALGTAGYQSPEISYYHSDPLVHNHAYFNSVHGVHSLAHNIYKNNPHIYPADGSGRAAIKKPDLSNDMWSIGVIAFEIRYGRQPAASDWPTIQADPLLKGLFTDRANRININAAINIHKDQIALRVPPLPPLPPIPSLASVSMPVPSVPLPPVPKRHPPLRRTEAKKQLITPAVIKGEAELLQALPPAPNPARPPLQRTIGVRQLPIQPLPPSGTPPRSETPPPPAGTPPGSETPPPPPARTLRRAPAIKSLRQPQDAVGELLTKGPQLQSLADPHFAPFLDAITFINSAQGKLIPKEEQAKCLYGLLAMIQLPPQQKEVSETKARFIKENKAYLENQFPQAIKPLKALSTEQMKAVVEGVFQPRKAPRSKKLSD